MFVIDRSFRNWKESKISALSKKVARSIKKNSIFDLDTALIAELEQRIEAVHQAKSKPFTKQAELKIAVNKATSALSKTMLKVADAVEKESTYKSDVILAGFHPGRVQRSPRYVKKSKRSS